MRGLTVTVIDHEAEVKVRRLHAQDPDLAGTCNIVPRTMERNAPEFIDGSFLRECRPSSIDVICVCSDDEVHALADALILQRHMEKAVHPPPIYLRTSSQAGIATILRKRTDGEKRARLLRPFPVLDRACTPRAIEELLPGRPPAASQEM